MSHKKWLIVALVFFLGVLLLLIATENTVDVETRENLGGKNNDYVRPLPKVSVISVMPQNHKGTIEVFSEISPRWETNLKAQVRGEILAVTEQALAGKRINKGDTLFRIEDSFYVSQVYEAEQDLVDTEINLQQEINRTKQAQKEWQRSGIKGSPSDLTLNKPQLKLAEKKVLTAKSRLDAAKKNLRTTQVRAPFSGFVINRYVSLGQAVSEGDLLLDIISSEQQDIRLSLSEIEWQLLDKNWEEVRATIHLEDGSQIGVASITHGGDFVDSETRQYSLFLEIDPQLTKVSTGSFVQVKLPSIVAINSLKIPEGSISRDGLIWFLDDGDHLQRFKAEVLFYSKGQVVIHQPGKATLDENTPQSWRIATTPLASFLPGVEVLPVKSGELGEEK